MKDTGYKRKSRNNLTISIPVQHRFIHNIDTKIVNMVDVENYSPTYSGDMPNFNTLDMMELKQFQESNSTQLLEKHNLLKTNISNHSKQKQTTQNENSLDTKNVDTNNVQPQKTE